MPLQVRLATASVQYQELMMAADSKIHWLAPANMLGGLIVGILFAVGHHSFYKSLAGTPVSQGYFLGTPVTSQQANTAIGTAFAFIVKACLIYSMSIAFVQLFWREAKACEGSTRAAPTLDRLDSMYSAFTDIVALFNAPLWCRYPLLLLLAVTAWSVSPLC